MARGYYRKQVKYAAEPPEAEERGGRTGGKMCRIYKAKSGWFVRLCYYHRERKGEHVSVPEGYELESRHYPRSGYSRSVNADCRGHSLAFSVTSFTNQAVVDDMARYAGACATWDEERGTVMLSSERGWKNVRPIMERAATFGWRRGGVEEPENEKEKRMGFHHG